MRHICLYIGVKIFSADGSTRGSTRGPRGPKNVSGYSKKSMDDLEMYLDNLERMILKVSAKSKKCVWII